VEPEPDRILFLGFQNQKRNRQPDEARPGLPSEGASPKDAEAIAKAERSVEQPYRYPSRIRRAHGGEGHASASRQMAFDFTFALNPQFAAAKANEYGINSAICG
jgi:hypothetical protein